MDRSFYCCKAAEDDDIIGVNAILDRKRGCTDCHMLLLFFAFLGGVFLVVYYAYKFGHHGRVLYGYDWKGQTCNEDALEGFDRLYWPNPLYYTEMGAVCLSPKRIGTDSGCPQNLPPKIYGETDFTKPMSLICVCNPSLLHGNEISDPTTKIGQLCTQNNSFGNLYGYNLVDVSYGVRVTCSLHCNATETSQS